MSEREDSYKSMMAKDVSRIAELECELAALREWRRGLTFRWDAPSGRHTRQRREEVIHGMGAGLRHWTDELCTWRNPDGSTECAWLAANPPSE